MRNCALSGQEAAELKQQKSHRIPLHWGQGGGDKGDQDPEGFWTDLGN
jgi:hypothetical protein